MKGFCSALLVGTIGCAVAVQFLSAAADAKEMVVHSFGNGTDGSQPVAGLLYLNGVLYGTTVGGGTNNDSGTIFSLDPKTDTETVVWNFGTGGTDGVEPAAGMILAGGRLYGTTEAGGASGYGTVFSYDPKTSVEAVVYSFAGGSDGAIPLAGLLDVKGTLYGTTEEGGTAGDGTAFVVDPKTGAERVLHSFLGGSTDGYYPIAAAIDVKGTLYGTTEHGGAHSGGTLFELSPGNGAEEVIHAFTGGTDGSEPAAALIDLRGKLYGTTVGGGTYNEGTAYSLDLANLGESVLYSFGSGGADGTYPHSSLIKARARVYSTTDDGGSYCTSVGGCGTVFTMDPYTGREKPIYSFGNGTDGAVPEAGLTDVNGVLYGTTSSGGAYGHGTVFSIKNF